MEVGSWKWRLMSCPLPGDLPTADQAIEEAARVAGQRVFPGRREDPRSSSN
jgi:hypothetical protein